MSEEDQERLEDYKGPGRYKATSQASSCLQLPLFALLWQENLVLPNALNFLLEEIQVECGLMLDFCISLFQVYCACYNTGNIFAHIFYQRFTSVAVHSCNRYQRFHGRSSVLSMRQVC